MFDDDDFESSDYSDAETRKVGHISNRRVIRRKYETLPKKDSRKHGGVMGSKVKSRYSIDQQQQRSGSSSLPAVNANPNIFRQPSQPGSISSPSVDDVRSFLPPSMPQPDDVTIEQAIAYFEKLKRAHRKLMDSHVFDFLCTVKSRSRAPMNALILDYDLIENQPSMNTLLGDSLSTILSQIASGASPSTVNIANLPAPLQSAIQVVGNQKPNVQQMQQNMNASTPPGTPSSKTTNQQQQQQQQQQTTIDASVALAQGLVDGGVQIADGITDAFGSLQSITLRELRKMGIALPIIAEYEKRKSSAAIQKMLRARSVFQQITFTPEFKGLMNAVLRRVTGSHPKLRKMKFQNFMNDSEVRTDLGEYTGLMFLERVVLPNPRGDAYVVTHPRLTRDIKSIAQNFSRAFVDTSGNVTYGEGGNFASTGGSSRDTGAIETPLDPIPFSASSNYPSSSSIVTGNMLPAIPMAPAPPVTLGRVGPLMMQRIPYPMFN